MSKEYLLDGDGYTICIQTGTCKLDQIPIVDPGYRRTKMMCTFLSNEQVEYTIVDTEMTTNIKGA